jgi:hypothetical protein
MFSQAHATAACAARWAPTVDSEVLVEYVLFGGSVVGLTLLIALPLVFARRRAKREPENPQERGKVTRVAGTRAGDAPN